MGLAAHRARAPFAGIAARAGFKSQLTDRVHAAFSFELEGELAQRFRGPAGLQIVNARVGVTKGSWDINLFAKNLFEEQAWTTYGGGRGGCSAASGAACTTFSLFNPTASGTTYRPREIGLQASMRY